jgi:hypothetical protein
LRVLDTIGAEARYGLHAVELRQAPGGHAAWLCGRLCVPGRILLFEQRPSPWALPGRLAPRMAVRTARAGAQLKHCAATDTTQVDWPDGALRRFMLLEVFLHEIGHHVFQHHRGKRTLRVVRTRDHEVFANAYAEQWRAICHSALDV